MVGFGGGITQPWYLYDAGAGGTFGGIWHHLDDLTVIGPPRGYFLDPNKSILVLYPWNVPQAEAFFQVYNLHIVTVRCYLGVFVGVKEA